MAFSPSVMQQKELGSAFDETQFYSAAVAPAFPQDMQDECSPASLSTAVSTPRTSTWRCADPLATSTGISVRSQQITEMFFEIESLEHSLLEEKQRSAALEEKKLLQEEAYRRDIAELEAALMKACIERDRLELEKNSLLRVVGKSSAAACSAFDADDAPTPRSVEEPEHEHACDIGHYDECEKRACGEAPAVLGKITACMDRDSLDDANELSAKGLDLDRSTYLPLAQSKRVESTSSLSSYH